MDAACRPALVPGSGFAVGDFISSAGFAPRRQDF